MSEDRTARIAVTMRSRKASLISGPSSASAARHAACAGGQFCSGKSDVVSPMSPIAAAADWWRRSAAFAFHPNRPMVPSVSSRLMRPEIPSPSASSGSSSAASVVSGTASSRPRPC